MAKRKKIIKYKNERIVMSDILPYEVPITFSNRHFYNFLVKNSIKMTNNCIFWKNKSKAFDKLVKFVFNIQGENIQEENGLNKCCIKKQTPYNYQKLGTIPFTYRISHKQNEYRELTLIHPINQLSVIDFYNTYKELILYYCNISPYSIRKPHKVARYTYYNDAKHKKRKAEEPERDIIENFSKEYENLKTFFSYKKYSNIHKFYESYTYQRNEKKFNRLHKFDINKCFDSIYTHSLSWALANKEIVKENLYNKINDFTFGGAFDKLMQKMNYNETNGIIIGPEFSRIFAEILLQQIDFSIYKQLEKDKIKHKTDYSIFRYVDDYFLFFNDENVKEKIIESYKHELIKYKMYINESKIFTYDKPIITDLTIAKERISDLLNLIIEMKEKDINNNNKKSADEDDNEKAKNDSKRFSLYFNSKKTIIDFKIIIKETGVEYKDILNYTLSVIDRKLFSLIQKYNKTIKKGSFENEIKEKKFKRVFIKAILELIDFIMFLYSVSPRVNTTIKLCITLTKITKFIKLKTEKENNTKYFNPELKNMVLKKIYDDISLVISKNKNTKYTQVESLYLLIILQDLGRDYRLDNVTLKSYLNIKEKKLETGELEFPYDFNYWSITVLLFYIRNIKRYESLKAELKKHILAKYKSIDINNISKDAGLVILTLDLLSTPYFNRKFKNELLKLCGISSYQRQILESVENIDIFTKWHNFDFERELNTKRSKEVY